MRRPPATLVPLIALMALIALLPLLLHLPEPRGALRFDRAIVTIDGAAPRTVALPFSWSRRMSAGPAVARYRIDFELRGAVSARQAILLPLSRVALRLFLNGRELPLQRAASWAEPITRVAQFAPVPDGLLRPGMNRIEIVQERHAGPRPGYLSAPYLGDAEAVAGNYQLRAFLGDQLRVTMIGVHLLLLVGAIAIGLLRPQDRIFGWFALAGTSSLVAGALELSPGGIVGEDWQNRLTLLPAVVTATAALGLARAAVRARPARWLPWLLPALPLLLLLGYAAQLPFALLTALTGIASVVLIAAAALELVRDYLRRDGGENGLLAAGWMLFIWFAALDIGTGSGLVDRGVLLLPYATPIMALVLAGIFLGRLAAATNRLDAANETLTQRLGVREAELAELHEQERVLATKFAREQERQRLMRDLHDGLSGHIASIIAMAEREAQFDIEQTAREALDDLRLVIHSLDIGSEDLPVVLGYFRERITPLFRRLGIELNWSMGPIPATTGLTPANALSLLRILQEAITNAIRHGPARVINVVICAGSSGELVISVENDGREIEIGNERGGNGLNNMRHRAASLGGTLEVSPSALGTRLRLTLPSELPNLGS
ncbi:ATP-binding protein [Sphingomonas sp. KR3-1]|uniref:sensor histidine kinase n=1 Tax=Sphingomonas sp. KR3-1 TaxID=3156611 RepID=UPI0032B33736